jgi:hypothetical protein
MSAKPKAPPTPIVMSQEVFKDRTFYVNGMRLYYSYYGVVPSAISLSRINYPKVIGWVNSYFDGQIVAIHSMDGNSRRNRKVIPLNHIFLLENGIMIDVDGDDSVAIIFQDAMREEANNICKQVKRFVKRERITHDISFVIDEGRGFRCVELPNKKPDLDLKLHYNDDMFQVHKRLVKKLGDNNGKGLVLLHGIPGTGKSTYIRYLIHHLKKRVIFLPSRLAGSLDAPSMMTFLIDYRNSILIIEDAEELIQSRENSKDSGVSALLNLTDGVLGESLSIQVICTFNTKLANIDGALLRKGRLIQEYEFAALSIDKTRHLLEKLGESLESAATGMTLADIYHLHETNQVTKKTSLAPIGFRLQ